MRFRRTTMLLAVACLPLWVEAQTPPPPATDPPANPSEAPAQRGQTAKDDADVQSARDAVHRAGGQAAGGGGYQSLQPPGTGGGLRGWITSRQPREKAAWIGISTSAASPVLRHQLKLHEGTGLVVDFVQPKSPADEAGVKQYDLIEKLDDQLLVNSEQFAVLVRTFKPGDEVKLTFFREGKRQTLSMKLAEHEVPRLRDAVPFQEFQMPQPVPVYPAIPAPGAMRGSADLFGSGRAENSLTWLDGKQALTITTKDGHSTVTALEKPSGKVLYTYPIDTDEERAALPKEIRERLARLKFPPGAKYDELRIGSDSKDPTAAEPPPPPAAR